MTRVTRPALAALLACLLIGTTARVTAAQQVGVRAGASGNPDQFYFGGHVEVGPVVESLWFRPNLEIGVGNNVTLTAINIEFAYKFQVNQLKRKGWHLYAGGGPGLNVYRRSGETDPEGGFNLLFGIEHQRGLFAEVKAGLVNSPHVKIGVGYTFKR